LINSTEQFCRIKDKALIMKKIFNTKLDKAKITNNKSLQKIDKTYLKTVKIYIKKK